MPPKNRAEWKKVRKTPPYHVKVRELIRKKGPMFPREIIKEIKIKETTLYAVIKNMKDWGEIKQLKNGKYADYQYEEKVDQVEEIMKVLKDCGCDEGFWDIEDWEEDKIEKELGDAFKTVTSKLLLDKNDPEVRKNFLEAIRRITKESS